MKEWKTEKDKIKQTTKMFRKDAKEEKKSKKRTNIKAVSTGAANPMRNCTGRSRLMRDGRKTIHTR